MNFNSEEYSHSTGGGSKILKPGQHFCRILELGLSVPPWNDDAYFVTLKLEGPNMGEGFEGVAIDKDNPGAGLHAGQIATVNNFRYPFSTYEWQGKTIERDQQIFNWINALATQLGVFKDIQAAKIQADTIEQYVEKVSPFLTHPELWAHFTVAGREYYKDGYDSPNYNLFFPKKSGKNFPYSAIEDDKGSPMSFLKYNEAEHIIKETPPAPATDVDSFGGGNDTPAAGTPSLDLD
jgi:hypothetical protein